MKIGIFGTGSVGKTIATKLIDNNHQVIMGSRNANNEIAESWKNLSGKNASSGTFAEVARESEIIFNCTKGEAVTEVFNQAAASNLKGKIVIDVSNPLDGSKGFPPSLSICNTDSLGETLQRLYPETFIVKALNTLSAKLMVNPAALKEEHDLFICGNDASSKEKVTDLLKKEFGWKNIIDLGDITNARGTEMILPLWLRLYVKYGNADFNFHVSK